MKKFLSLVLALVMTMSLVTVAGAKDFTDADKVNYDEAVDVISALEIVGGYADGSFNPTGTLTRGAAAKIICNILVGPKAAAELTAVSAPFADVAVDNVFAGYIAYCVNEGIIAGYGDGNFGPSNPLTGYAFLKMLLTALGYDQTAEGYVGTNAQVNILLDAKAVKTVDGADDGEDADTMSLLAGLNGTFNGTKAITREEACLFALNALKALKVTYENENSANITIGDISISTGLGSVTYGEQLFTVNFEDLAYEPADNEMGLPSTLWTLDGEEIGVYADAADLIVKNAATDGDLYKLMGKTEATEYEYAKDGETPVVADGQIAYFYYDSNTVEFVETLFGQVTAVSEDDAEDEDDVAYVEITEEATGYVYYYETDKLEEEDYVIFYADQKTELSEDEEELYAAYAYGVTKPATKDGTITSVKFDGETVEYVKVEGEKTVYNHNGVEDLSEGEVCVLNAAGDDVYTFYYDYAGAVIAVNLKEEAEESYNYVWVIETDAEVAGANLLNAKKDVAKVKVLFMDGKVETVDYEIAYAAKADADAGLAKNDPYFVLNGEKVKLEETDDASTSFEDAIAGGFYAFTKTAKGYTFRTIDDAKVTGATVGSVSDYEKEEKTMTAVVGEDEVVYNLTAKTTFTTVGEDGSVKTKTGYKNIETIDAATTVLVLHAKDSVKATAIYTVVEEESTTETVNYAYFVSAGETNADEDVECTFWVGGKQVKYWVTLGEEQEPALGEVYDLTVEDGVATIEIVNPAYTGEITVLDDEYMIVDDNEVEFAKEYEVYQISLNQKTLTKAALAEEKHAHVFTTDDEVTLVLIIHARNVVVEE